MSIHDWLQQDAVETDPNDPAGLDPLIGLVDDSVELLGIGEPMHGDETFLRLLQLMQEGMRTHEAPAEAYRRLGLPVPSLT